MDDFDIIQKIAVSGMKAQTTRLRVVSENMANADSLSDQPGGDPYRRQVITFKSHLDRATGADTVKVNKIDQDKSDFKREYMPHHPAADEGGYVMKPNVDPLIEMMDMREAQRSYEANLKIMSASKDMVGQTLGLLK